MTCHYLAIGINAYPEPNRLAGCVNDARDWAAALEARGYIGTTLIDGEATAEGILGEIRDLMRSTRRGDRVVVTFSGHGTQVWDRSGDEPDGYDEAIVPVDFETAGVITDDVLGAALKEGTYGSHTLFVADSCFSGTVERFAAVGDGPAAVTPAGQPRFLHLPAGAQVADGGEGRTRGGIRSVAKVGGVCLFSGANDRETAADASFGGRPNGAFTYWALKTLPAAKSLRKWRTATADALAGTQHPTVDGPRTQLNYWQPL